MVIFFFEIYKIIIDFYNKFLKSINRMQMHVFLFFFKDNGLF